MSARFRRVQVEQEVTSPALPILAPLKSSCLQIRAGGWQQLQVSGGDKAFSGTLPMQWVDVGGRGVERRAVGIWIVQTLFIVVVVWQRFEVKLWLSLRLLWVNKGSPVYSDREI